MESVSWLRFALASTVVLGLMAFLAWGLKRLAERGWIRTPQTNSRMKILSAIPLDARRRLVLARCDDKDYLLLLGGNNDLLLDSKPLPPTEPPAP